jgi:4'-phosphopantetheinyl transferase
MPACQEIAAGIAGVRLFLSSKNQAHSDLAALLEKNSHYSLSYAGDIALIALSTQQVGVDIAKIDPAYPAEEVSRHFFSPTEHGQLMALPPPERINAFFRAWTCKEAYIKAIGLGFSFPVDQCEVVIDPKMPAKLLKIEGSYEKVKAWRLSVFCPMSGYCGALIYRNTFEI